MSSITENELRIGRFTSSNMHKLMSNNKDKSSFGVPGLTYINEKKLELKMGRSLSIEKYSRSTLWGHFLEQRVHDMLPKEYESIGKVTLQHQTIKEWSGSPDNRNLIHSIVGDTKCFEPKAFAEYVDNLTEAIGKSTLEGQTDFFKEQHPEEYWQLISNAIITGMKYIEAIVYMPYESELKEIAQEAEDYDNFDQYKYKFIADCAAYSKSELPYLPDNGYYRNINRFLFEVPKKDVDLLTGRVLKAIELLNS